MTPTTLGRTTYYNLHEAAAGTTRLRDDRAIRPEREG